MEKAPDGSTLSRRMSLHAVLELDVILVGVITAWTPRRRRSNNNPDGGRSVHEGGTL
jgi:hypothetical protein